MAVADMPTILPAAAAFTSRTHKLLINNQWVPAVSGKTFTSINPATGEVLATIADGQKEDVDLAVAAARKAFDSGAWPKMPPSQRAKLIWKLADLLEANLEEFATLESLDNGKPLSVARAADVP